MGLRLLAAALVACCFVGASSMAARAAGGPGDEVFGLTRLHPIHLAVAAEDYAAMDAQQPAGMFGFGGPPPGGPPANGPPPGGRGGPAPGSNDFGAGNFGFEFKYVGADMQAADLQGNDQTFPKVGLRYKGSGTYLVSQRQAKRSFKIDLDKYGATPTFDGLTKLNLNSNVMDPSKAHEALAYIVFRAAGVPAPRTAFAEVTLTVPGKYDKEYLGLYTIVEQVDERFLETYFGDGKGLLLKPEGIRGLPHFGDDPAAYEQSYNAKSKPGLGDWNRLVELTRLVNKADDAEFNERIGEYLDIDGFVRFLAANTLLASLDGFIGMGHNYYLYLSPVTGKFSFLPWDLDLAFGAFAIYGTPEQMADLSVDHPHVGENKLIDRLLAIPEVKAAYREQVRRLAAEAFTVEKLGSDFAAIEQITARTEPREKSAATARKESSGFGPMGAMFAGLPLRTFVEKRVASVAAQLAGEEAGYVPKAMAFGPPGGFGPPPGASGQANLVAPAQFDAFDADKNSRIDESEFAAGMKKFFVEWDKDKNGALNQGEIAEGLQKLISAAGPRR